MIKVREHVSQDVKEFPENKLVWLCKQVACPTGEPTNQQEMNRADMYRRKIMNGGVVTAGGFDIWRS